MAQSQTRSVPQLGSSAELEWISPEVIRRLKDVTSSDDDAVQFMAIGVIRVTETVANIPMPTADVVYASPCGNYVLNRERFGRRENWRGIPRSIPVPSGDPGPEPTPDYLEDQVNKRLSHYTGIFHDYDGPDSA